MAHTPLVRQFSLGQVGGHFEVKLLNADGSVYDLTNVSGVFLVFYKPNGIRIKVDAILRDDPLKPGEQFVEYYNHDESILDTVGKWEVSGGAVLLNDDTFETSEHTIFWVV